MPRITRAAQEFFFTSMVWMSSGDYSVVAETVSVRLSTIVVDFVRGLYYFLGEAEGERRVVILKFMVPDLRKKRKGGGCFCGM